MLWAKCDFTSRAKWDHDVPLYWLKKIKMQFVLSSHAYNISLTFFSRCTSLIVIIEKSYLVNNMHEECLFIQVRYNTTISPVHVIPTLQTCRIVRCFIFST